MREKQCHGTSAGFVKYENNPVLGGNLGTCFDISMLYEENLFKMYFSWRDKKSVALTTSKDGIHFSEPVLLISPVESEEGWEDDINRPSIVRTSDGYHMWYTGQYHETEREGTSHIFHAFSEDGIHFVRTDKKPVLFPDQPWENTSIMNPSVLYDKKCGLYKMWFSAGSQYEPRAIGYAESKDGIVWKKYEGNPIFQADPEKMWEQHKVAGCQVISYQNKYLMFYIGYYNEDYAQVGIAVSEDGKTNWIRYEKNPIIAPDEEQWDGDACYKPFAIQIGENWYLWYNGRKGHKEQIGLVVHEGAELLEK